MWQAFVRFANDEESGPLIQVARFAVGLMLCAGWVIGANAALGALGASDRVQWLAAVFGLPALAAAAGLVILLRNTQMFSCPCQSARPGAFIVVFAVYWLGVIGVAPVLAHVMQGDVFGIAWAAFAGFGVLCLVVGIGDALTHDDPFRRESFLWSVGVLALGSYALQHHWYLTDSADPDYHLGQSLWLAWMASNAVNLWLQLRGQFRRVRVPVPAPDPAPRIPRLRRRRRVTTEWLDEIEGHGIEGLRHRIAEAAASPPAGIAQRLIELNGKLYVEHGGAFVPVGAPKADDALPVPVNRRLR